MDVYPNGIHIVLYYDQELYERDGNGWCVEFSDSETTERFGTLAGASAYASLFGDVLKNSKTAKLSL